jgi:sugar phosphate isomerase/epimerase
MPHLTDRRRFMMSAAAATAGVATKFSSPAMAIEPIARIAGPHFKFSLAAYSYRDLLTGPNAKLSLVEFIDDCARFGLDGTELTSYYFPEQPTPEYLRNLKSAAFRNGLDISGTAIRNDFCFPPGEEREHEIAHVKRWIENADAMDAPVIRIFSGAVKRGQSVDEAQQLAIDGIEECCDYAGKYGVFLALENHGGLTTEVDGMLAIVRRVESPWFGVNLDSGNFRTADPYGDLAKIAPYAVNVQVKVVVHPEGQPAQPTDFARLATILRTSGYRGYIVLEFEEAGDPREECRKYVDEIRTAFA